MRQHSFYTRQLDFLMELLAIITVEEEYDDAHDQMMTIVAAVKLLSSFLHYEVMMKVACCEYVLQHCFFLLPVTVSPNLSVWPSLLIPKHFYDSMMLVFAVVDGPFW